MIRLSIIADYLYIYRSSGFGKYVDQSDIIVSMDRGYPHTSHFQGP